MPETSAAQLSLKPKSPQAPRAEKRQRQRLRDINQFDQLSCFKELATTRLGSTFHFWHNILDQHLDQHLLFDTTWWINILINICFLDQHIGSTSWSTYFILDQHFGSTSKVNWINMDQHRDQHRHLGNSIENHALIAAYHAVFCFVIISSPHTVRFSISSWFHRRTPCGFLFHTDRTQLLISYWINIFCFGSTYWINIWINILTQHWLMKMLIQMLIKMLIQFVDPKITGCWSKSTQMLIQMLIRILKPDLDGH